ncbi:hypothetical protein TNIN_367961 [Trichonephila inaurata madagascariensis]|uniref:Uncharacterized protein n=1 Tax=Trichonephila inaurata madagascariensis TaxID=2747483 RepID=A0A8X6MH63_9ARAC|nr:hypothetical protein TNIN_367961 [Trichonephila inaurata madagascariensis]
MCDIHSLCAEGLRGCPVNTKQKSHTRKIFKPSQEEQSTCFGSVCSFPTCASYPSFDVCQKRIHRSLDQNIKDGREVSDFACICVFSELGTFSEKGKVSSAIDGLIFIL